MYVQLLYSEHNFGMVSIIFDILTETYRYSNVKDNALERITPGAPDLWAQVYHAVREEWALTAEDVIYHRTTLGLRGFDTPGIRQRISTVLEAGGMSPVRLGPLRCAGNGLPRRVRR